MSAIPVPRGSSPRAVPRYPGWPHPKAGQAPLAALYIVSTAAPYFALKLLQLMGEYVNNYVRRDGAQNPTVHWSRSLTVNNSCAFAAWQPAACISREAATCMFL